MIDEIEEIMEFQKIFLDVMSEIRSKNMMTFPVNSISLLKKDGKFVDEEFARYAIKHNMKWSDSNIFVDDSVNSLSNCPLSGDTKILYYSKYYDRYISSTIKAIHDSRDDDETITVLSNGEEIECRINKFDIPADYEIKLVNGAVIKTTANHLNKVLRGNYVETKDLTDQDYLPISMSPFEKTKNMTYNDGKIVGMFLGDGSYRGEHDIVFSLNRNKKADLISFVYDYCQKQYGGTITESDLESSLSGANSCVNVGVKSDYLRGLIKQYVVGNNALNKEINPLAYTQSKEFRRGILDGLYATDGGNSNRIYTSSEGLKDSLVTLCATLGIATTISEDNRDGRLGTNTCYTVRYYTPNGRTCRKDFYIVKDGYFWVRIKSVDKIEDSRSRVSYCLEVVDNEIEPIFMLSNGFLTHNCRLKSEIKDLYFNSIGGSALKVGSVKVSTINLARLALENKTEDEYINALKDLVVLDLKALDRVRHIIKRNVDKGLLNNFSCGLVDFEHLYSTIGFLGVYETMKTFGYITVDEFGNTYYTDDAERFGKKIFDTIHSVKDEFAKEKGYMINCEQIPGETAAVKLMRKDKFFFGDKVVSDLPLYGNQFIPLGIKTTLQERIRIASMFDKFCNGGSILHVNIDAPFTNFEQAWDLLNYITDMGVTYFAFNTKIQACKNNHAFYGNICPECCEPVDTEYTRIVGFYTPVKTYSQERKEEYGMRRWEDINS